MGLVIQIRGTSGSGKTWTMRRVMERLSKKWEPHYIPRRRIPLYYTSGNLVVLGSYENPITGGCDGVAKPPIVAYCGKDGVEAVYTICNNLLKENPKRVILTEGLLLSEDSKWTPLLKDVRCLFLTTPVIKCKDQVESRRELSEASGRKAVGALDKKKGLTKGGKPKLTAEQRIATRAKTIDRARNKLITLGVLCRRCPCVQAVDLIVKWAKSGKL